MCASVLISLLAAFVAMLGKQCLNQYLRNSGGSMIDRCGDRQRQKWPLNLFVESLPVMLQVALLLLACGLCRHMWSINTSVACTFIALTGFGVLFHLTIVIAGTSSYACPFQTPASITLHGLWRKLRQGIPSFIVRCRKALRRTHRMWNRSVRLFRLRQPPPLIPLEYVHVTAVEARRSCRHSRTNVNDVRCVVDSQKHHQHRGARCRRPTRRNGSLVRGWDQCRTPLRYDSLHLHACFGINGKVYPGSRDRAYYSMWIRTFASCKSEEFVERFPLVITEYTAPASDYDLAHLLRVNGCITAEYRFA